MDFWKWYWKISNIVLGYGSYILHIYTAYNFYLQQFYYYFGIQVTMIVISSLVSGYLIIRVEKLKGFFLWICQLDCWYSTFRMDEDNRYKRNHYFVLLECIPAIFLSIHSIATVGDRVWSIQASLFLSILTVCYHNMIVLNNIPLNRGYKDILKGTYQGFFYVLFESFPFLVAFGFFCGLTKPWGVWIISSASLLLGFVLFFNRWNLGKSQGDFAEYLSLVFTSASIGCFFTSRAALIRHNIHKITQYTGIGVIFAMDYEGFFALFDDSFYISYGIAGGIIFCVWVVYMMTVMCSSDWAKDTLNLREDKLEKSRKLIPDETDTEDESEESFIVSPVL